MAGQEIFLEAVREIEAIARTNGGRLSVGDISQYFEGMKLGEKQIEPICHYLESRGIEIEGREAAAEDEYPEPVETKADPLDEHLVSIYAKEAARASRLSRDQEQALVRKLMNGDERARILLIEANLSCAMELAGEYKGRGLLMSDLIQEANIGLMTAVNEYEPALHGDFFQYKEKMIRTYIIEALREYNQSTRSALKMANRANELDRTAAAFAREYEREARPAELAERMGISEEEVRELMKVSLDAVAILDEGKITGWEKERFGVKNVK